MPRKSMTVLPLLLCLASHVLSQAPATAIVNVNVVDVSRGEIRSGQTVVIAGGRIEAVAPAGKAQIPSGALRVPGDGRYLIPGLWDMHVHLRGEFELCPQERPL